MSASESRKRKRATPGDEKDEAAASSEPTKKKQKGRKGLQKDVCACSHALCRQYTEMWREAASNKGKPAYRTYPSEPAKNTTAAGKAKTLEVKLVSTALPLDSTTAPKRPRISVPFHHHLPVINGLWQQFQSSSRQRWRFPTEVLVKDVEAWRGSAEVGWKSDRKHHTADGKMVLVPDVGAEAAMAAINYDVGENEKKARQLARAMEAASDSGALAAAVQASEAMAVAEAVAGERGLNEEKDKIIEQLRKENADLRARASAGLNRFLLMSDAHHDRNPDDASHYFGIPGGWSAVKVWVLECSFPTMSPECAAPGAEGLSDFEACLATKMYFKTGWELTEIAKIWGVSRQTMGTYARLWAPRWAAVARFGCRLLIDLDFIKASQPADFPDRYGTAIIACEVDGKDFRTETVRSNNKGKKVNRSNKYKGQAARCITWTIPGTGLVVLSTDLFCGRATECELVRIHGSWLCIFPPGTCRLVDRGFAFTTRWYPNVSLLPRSCRAG